MRLLYTPIAPRLLAWRAIVVELICTVRGCARGLAAAGSTLRCPQGHAFDRAREGYWNLLQPQDRRSRTPGDRREATDARGRWLERGFADGLVETLAGVAGIAEAGAGTTALDVGCGDGWFAARLFDGRSVELCGIDLSVFALRRAARRAIDATWVVANADRGLPLATASVDLALSIHGRRPAGELARVLRPRSVLVVVLPAEDDLIELRQAAQGLALRRDRADGAIAELAPSFALRARQTWRRRIEHDRAALEDALAMTYRGVRRADRERLRDVEGLVLTLAAEILVFEATARR